MELEDAKNTPMSRTASKAKEVGKCEELLQEFYSNVTLHGFRFLFEGHWFRKLIWFIIISGVFAFSCYSFIDLLEQYLRHATQTQTKKVFKENFFEFPTITFCPLSTMSKKKLEKLPFNYTLDWFTDTEKAARKTNASKKFFSDLNGIGVDNLIDFYSLFHVGFEDLISSDVIDQFQVYSNAFYGQSLYWDLPNSFKKKLWKNIPGFSPLLCFQFNSLSKEIERLSANNTNNYFDGLFVFFDLGGIDFDYNFSGMIVMVTDYGDNDDVKPSNTYISVSPGENTFIKLTERQVSNIFI